MTTTIYDGGNQVTVIKAAPPPPSGPTAPTISGMSVTPNSLPIGGGQVKVDANVTGQNVVVTLKVDGVDKGPVTLPYTFTLT